MSRTFGRRGARNLIVMLRRPVDGTKVYVINRPEVDIGLQE
jgi:hypothetical protein